jgi:hypothetical protein
LALASLPCLREKLLDILDHRLPSRARHIVEALVACQPALSVFLITPL